MNEEARLAILNEAKAIANNFRARTSHLEREIIELEAKVAEKKRALQDSNFALKRLSDFKIVIGNDYQCPRCWIEREIRSRLLPRPGGNSRQDVFSCGPCGFELIIRD